MKVTGHGLRWLLLIVVMICSYGGSLQAACMGSVPIWGTGEDKASCIYKQKLKRKEQRLNIREREKKLKRREEGINNNTGIGAGMGNTNVILGGLPGGGKNQGIGMSSDIRQTIWQMRAEYTPFVIPGAAQFDDPGMPERALFPTGIAAEYYVSPNLSFGFVFQKWGKKGGKNFDPIFDNSGDVIHLPGQMERMEYTLYMPTISINWRLGDSDWHGILRGGIGRNEVQVEYKTIDRFTYPKAGQPENITYTDNTAILIDIAAEKYVSGMKWGVFFRWIDSKTDTSDYMKYTNLGSTHILGISVQFMLEPFGLL